MNWIRLVYGTAILAALAGTAIFYTNDRTVVRAIDIIELTEATRERLMPFGYTLATNTLIYEQAVWTTDPSTNRWQQGTNQIPYLIYNGTALKTDSWVGVSSICEQGNSWGEIVFNVDAFPYYWPVPVSAWAGGPWEIETIQTGRTVAVDWLHDTNEYPAYVFVPHVKHGVGFINQKATLDWIDSAILGSPDYHVNPILPRYVDHESAINGVFTNSYLPMLTVSSVWTRLNLPYIWTNVSRVATNSYTNWVDSWTNALGVVTNISRIGTNLAWVCSTNITTNYTFTTGPVCTTNMLNERYKVLSYLKWTTATWKGPYEIWPTNLNWWYGEWTNATKTVYTNIINSAVNYHTNHWDYVIIDNNAFPAWAPSWWVGSLSNDPPESWKSPISTPTIDDITNVFTSCFSTNMAYDYPRRNFSTVGNFSKGQWWYNPGNGGEGVGFSFYSSTNNILTNVLTAVDSHPVIRVPYNIGGISVTGDVYCAVNGLYGPRTRTLSSDMTSPHSNAFFWVGSAMQATNSVFDATNFPCEYSFYYNRHLAYAPIYSAYWGITWNISKNVFLTPKDVVFKWTFSRCRP